MILIVTATEMELRPILAAIGQRSDVATFVCGVGVVEAATRLTRFLCEHGERIRAMVNVGIGGAYLQPLGLPQPGLLDVCVGRREILGDLGINFTHRFEPLAQELGGGKWYELAGGPDLQRQLSDEGYPCLGGDFITVCGVSGTRERGEVLRRFWNGLCENMEGAAVARVAEEFALPLYELRAVSNMVEQRNRAEWKVAEAIDRIPAYTSKLLEIIS